MTADDRIQRSLDPEAQRDIFQRLGYEPDRERPQHGDVTADDFPADPFGGPEVPFIDRLTALMEMGMNNARTSGWKQDPDFTLDDVMRLLGDRETVAEEIQAKIMRELPGSDSNETWKGILSTLDYLFGPEAS